MTEKRLTVRQTAFLEALACGISISKAARETGIHRTTAHKWRRTDKLFAEAFLEAEQAGADAIEDEALRRAVEGIEKPVFRGGEIIGHVRDYSDTMLGLLLKARRPEKYGTGKSEQSDDKKDFSGARDALLRKFAQAMADPQAEELPEQSD